MFAASHIAAGSLLYDALKDEPSVVARTALGLGGCLLSHWLLDLVPVYHDMDWPWQPFQWGVAALNAAAMITIWHGGRNGRHHWWKPSSRFLWGLVAWVPWDIGWMIDPAGGGLHRLIKLLDGVEPGMRAGPHSFFIEAMWIVFAILISLPVIREWRNGSRGTT